ncbi:hypothetical protein [Cellulomonas fimi]|uniref:DUF5666 domain-containing protein n=1 Tax=Cellulomonas fimi (strain ATCC 484 / DSM 20113 / JCM 1341 / CCUG 24087 / LMG 16345 / NBRC 15513 / NCIMB 8980 / NCTC 7547 / NRS-133) TaxID=590998 RepID=F4H0N1_CELFA|nr:hypothetical protein [Cellulomonas fimi]AEE45004.1 hypothetical protein Celf_0866 [Cellulomonas fimi ATCC 484]NNH09011.1 hypothetical protein [Cellulomonas fimi]VEH27944.1 Uncharacterised protein [Cellulomonas fimi]
MTSTPTLARRPHGAVRTRPRDCALALPAVGLVLALAGCAGSTAQPAATDDATASDAPAQRSEDRGRVVGEIATVGDALLQVRGTDEQTAVTWSDATTITQTVAATLADVTVGVCVVAVAAPSSSTGADASDDASDAPVEATSVTVSAAQDDGTCTTAGGPGGGGAPGDLPGGAPTDLPSGVPTDGPAAGGERPDGAPQVRAFGAGVGGQVTAVSGSTLSVRVTAADGTTSDRQVVVSDATTYQRTAAADASALVAGRCATVRGEADDSGEVAATAIQVTDPTDDGCTSGFAVRGPGGAPGQGGTQDEEGTDA